MNIKNIISCMVFLFATLNVTVKCEEKNNKKDKINKNNQNTVETNIKNIKKSIDDFNKNIKRKVENFKNKTKKSNFKEFLIYMKKHPIKACFVMFAFLKFYQISLFFLRVVALAIAAKNNKEIKLVYVKVDNIEDLKKIIETLDKENIYVEAVRINDSKGCSL
jgi:hypothetical protein